MTINGGYDERSVRMLITLALRPLQLKVEQQAKEIRKLRSDLHTTKAQVDKLQK
mgnify:CR=1 FL=1